MMLWSSVKPFQSVAIPYRYRSGCRMMCPTGCLFPVSCVARCVLACRFLIRFVLPPRRACRASLRLSASYRRLTLSRLIRFVCLLVSYGVSTPRPVVLISRACPSHLIRSSCPLLLRLLASPCLSSPPLVSPGGAFCVSLSSCHASRLPSCVLLAALRSAHPMDAIADVLVSFLRSAATVPPPTLLALSPRLFVSGGGEMSGGQFGCYFFLWDFCAVWCFSYRACAIMCAVAMGTSEWEAFVPRSHSLTSLRWGRRSFVASITASPLLLYPRRSSLLNRPAFLPDRRGDFFLLTHHHVIIACLPSADVAIISCGAVFWRFYMRPFAYPFRCASPSHPYSARLS